MRKNKKKELNKEDFKKLKDLYKIVFSGSFYSCCDLAKIGELEEKASYEQLKSLQDEFKALVEKKDV